MRSMSYVMFENTADAMDQAVSKMETADSWEEMELSSTENNAKNRLYRLCQQYIQYHNDLNNNDYDIAEDFYAV